MACITGVLVTLLYYVMYKHDIVQQRYKYTCDKHDIVQQRYKHAR
jgi:hypothetical protein